MMATYSTRGSVKANHAHSETKDGLSLIDCLRMTLPDFSFKLSLAVVCIVLVYYMLNFLLIFLAVR
jgi:hypothetical protein